ncbi:2,3-diaminopropionate biosynthesis protein SbnA [Streptomyces sp. HD]|uniref:2,3-diaminopropionate biosynthesis protein SbnA n=1 Tax=Streptomyces sp. HD TaxID=3020892 RepID=UPI00232D5163|nr:2,3-diaminopropionate biosynthesis protein SbnA [Streptomyces sp. HD]MDC0770834.1 2,3-diaminopropionate biosynthesis protein SbnA [Streptomyces sp. HD]
MPTIQSPDELFIDDLYVNLQPILDRQLLLKCEGFNFAGSVKLKAATSMVEAAEREGRLRPGSVLVESSSGNLGVALAVVAASRGYQFVCVTDPRSNATTRALIEAVGARVVLITKPDAGGGYLGSRISYVQELCRQNPAVVWLNQYASPYNWQAHYELTAPAIDKYHPDLDYLFVGAGTTGTLMGCARYFREHRPDVRIVAVDSVGSVTFGGLPTPRYIPGLGTSRRPEILDGSLVDEVILVDEADTVTTCRELARHGYLFGGSTGTVVSAARNRLPEGGDAVAVAIAPDLADRYVDTLYNDAWVIETFGPLAGLHAADPSELPL